ncbi:MAG: hypothetical protein H6Q25_1008 [Bacteroidetes bacterium]|nr:hypothetical protein [Bacteroidota bacterium]
MKKAFLISSIVLLISTLSLKAQIFYLEITPDVESEMSPIIGSMDNIFPLDFTFDGLEEYNFKWEDLGSEWFMHFTSSNPNNLIALDGTTVNIYNGRFVKMLSFGDPINNSLTWGTSDPDPYIGESTMNTNFLDQGDQYIGVKFLKNNNTHYGYVLVNFQSTTPTNKVDSRKLIIKAFAFNNTPNAQISAGQTSSSSVDESVEVNFEVYPNPTQDMITIQTNSDEVIAYAIYNTFGQKVNQGVINNNVISMKELEAGIYFIKLMNPKTQNIETFKVVKL